MTLNRKSKVTLDAAMSTVRVVTARHMASAALVGFEVAEEEGRPLTQVQQGDILTNLFLSFHDAIAEIEDQLELELSMQEAILGD